MRRVDIEYDCGVSLNPLIDVGQIEGGFMFGTGYFTQEEVTYDATTGASNNASTWTYKPPCAYDVPYTLNTTMLPNAPNPLGVMGSKGSGEPGVCLGTATVRALEEAVNARVQQVNPSAARYVTMSAPFTVERIQQACNIQVSQMVIA
jgi:xanthine dehydrogenase/oxidase